MSNSKPFSVRLDPKVWEWLYKQSVEKSMRAGKLVSVNYLINVYLKRALKGEK